jgi:hypothetical protein
MNCLLRVGGFAVADTELLPKGETIILAGAPKQVKTLLAIDAAFAIALVKVVSWGEKVTQVRYCCQCDESLTQPKSSF